MSFSRRQILKAATVTSALSIASKISPVRPAHAEVFSGRRVIVRTGSTAAIIDLDTCNVNLIALGFDAHSFVQNPRHPERVWAVQMHPWPLGKPNAATGDKICAAEMDIREKKILQRITLPYDQDLAGHGLYTADGNVLFIPRMDRKNNVNYMTGYDANDCKKVVADYAFGPGVPHDAQRFGNDGALVVCHGITDWEYTSRTKKDELLQIDLNSGKTVRKWVFEDEKQMLGHFAALRDGTLIVMSDGVPGHLPGKAYGGSHEDSVLQEISFESIDPGKPGELLSIAVNEAQDKAIVSNRVTFVLSKGRALVLDLKRMVFEREIAYGCGGVVFDRKSGYFIGCGDDIALIDGNGNILPGKENKRLSKLGVFDSPHGFLAEAL